MHCCSIQASGTVVCAASVLIGLCVAAQSPGDELPRASGALSTQEEHPLTPILEYARAGYTRINADIQDYTCTLTRRERVAGKLSGYQQIYVKIRHQSPSHSFSVYLRFLRPADVKDREVLYAPDQRNGDILVRRGGTRLPSMTLQLDPTGDLAMEGNRYPIMEIGFKTMVTRIIEVVQEDLVHRDVRVTYFKAAKLQGRDCTHFQVVHPVQREGVRYHMARVLVDNEMQVPVYFASYDWPEQPGGQPVLLEEYIYSNVQLNVGLTDMDFDRSNPEYRFSTIEQAAAVRK